jgi:predicted regulator of Ras-like GTPase activity (Roadblock/LC7/MglB family)
MADPFLDALKHLVQAVPGITGAAFTDLDGEEIAVHPRERREELRLAAAYEGIALRRLGQAELRAGRTTGQSLIVRGSAGALVALRVGDQYQILVQARSTTHPEQVLFEARQVARTLEANL